MGVRVTELERITGDGLTQTRHRARGAWVGFTVLFHLFVFVFLLFVFFFFFNIFLLGFFLYSLGSRRLLRLRAARDWGSALFLPRTRGGWERYQYLALGRHLRTIPRKRVWQLHQRSRRSPVDCLTTLGIISDNSGSGKGATPTSSPIRRCANKSSESTALRAGAGTEGKPTAANTYWTSKAGAVCTPSISDPSAPSFFVKVVLHCAGGLTVRQKSNASWMCRCVHVLHLQGSVSASSAPSL